MKMKRYRFAGMIQKIQTPVTHDNLFLLTNILFVCSFAISQWVANMSLALLGLFFLFSLGKKAKLTGKQKVHLILSLAIVLSLSAIAFATVHNTLEAFKTIEKYIPLLAVPLILSNSPRLNRIKRSLIPWSFTVAIFGICVYCLAIGLHHFMTLEPTIEQANEDLYNRILSPWNYLSYEKLLEPVNIHPSYLSIFVSFSIFHLLLSERTRVSLQVIRYILVIFFVTFLFLLASRTGIISFVITMIILATLSVRTKKAKFKKVVPFLILVTGIFMSTFYLNDYFRKRLYDLNSSFNTNRSVEEWNAVNLRLAIWKCNLGIAQNNLSTGIGFADDKRTECYQRYSFYPHYGTFFNAHNQFLEYLVLGGLGLLVLSLLYFANFSKMAFDSNNMLFKSFIVLLVLSLLTECVLSRIAGIFFASYFLSFFIFLDPENNDV